MIVIDDIFHKHIEAILENPLKGDKLKSFIRDYIPRVDAKKALGILYPVIVEFEEAGSMSQKVFGRKVSRKEALTIAHFFISQSETQLSEHGDARVTEALNYFKLDEDVIKAYYTTL